MRKKYQSIQTLTVDQNLLNKVQTTYEIWQTIAKKLFSVSLLRVCVCICLCVFLCVFDHIGSFSLYADKVCAFSSSVLDCRRLLSLLLLFLLLFIRFFSLGRSLTCFFACLIQWQWFPMYVGFSFPLFIIVRACE